ncbi:MAG: elongation factor P [Eubacteriales bacterium]|jgi:elongation factor P
MVTAGDFRNGLTFEMDGNVMQVIEFQHVKPGKGAAFVRTKLRNVIVGSVVEMTFSPSDKFPTAVVERKDMQYSYSDGELYYFMDMDTYDQVPLNADKLPDSFKYVKEGDVCRLVSYKGNVFSVEPPTFVELEVVKADPGVRGNTATNVMKLAEVETGATIKVPMFINEGDKIKIDTRTGEYLERV